ncbi:MAG: exodeoxyribonuclease V subunit gamma [Thermodesulfobacteria bacterium]|nr:exodeoxyribonuclease V subunit gamma [Thermodesulfobacteriota bacterium]
MEVFTLHQSNRMEELARELARVMEGHRQEQFCLTPDIVLVNNYEMGQYLSMNIARGSGICANVRFSLLGSFIWSVTLDAFGDQAQEALTRQKVRWAIFECLKEMTSEGGKAKDELLSYASVRGEEGLFHLAGRLEVIFDRYLNHRYSMLMEWEKGQVPKGQGWQRDLWLRLCSKFGDRFRTKKIRKLLEELAASEGVWQRISKSLTGRLYVFGISYLTPLHLELLDALSRRLDVHVFMLNPCRKYWQDIVPQKSKWRKLASNTALDAQEIDALFPEGNQLLASLGRAGRSFLFRLYNKDFHESRDLFVDPVGKGQGNMLQRLQRDILDLEGPQAQVDSSVSPGDERAKDDVLVEPDDDSILINSCYSRLRETEALHNYLVHLFDTNPDLDPKDVAILAPNIGDYAQYIDAVFGSAPSERYIPYEISDQLGLSDSSQILRAYSMVFSMALGELTAPLVMDLLEHPIIMERRGLDQRAVVQIKRWIERSGARRGFDRLSRDVSETQNTWLFGLDRLFTTASMADVDPEETLVEPVKDLIEGDGLSWLGELSSFVHDLNDFCAVVRGCPEDGLEITKWRSVAMELIQRFISEKPQEDEACAPLVDRLNSLFGAMEDAGVEKVSFDVVNRAIQQFLDGPPPQQAFISGKVLCASLVPMRSLPFRVICLLGMDDKSFPRSERPPSFDIMAGSWRPGDRNPRDEDRYLFLETLISARERLWISYIGKREHDNAIQNPSTVVSELLDYLEKRFRPRGEEKLREMVVLEHPLQPFSQRYLSCERAPMRNYAIEWLPVDQKGYPIKQSAPRPLVDEGEDVVVSPETLEAMKEQSPYSFCAAFANPAKWYLENVLGVYLGRLESALPDHEPFEVEADLDTMFISELSSGKAESLLESGELEDLLYEKWLSVLRRRGLIPVGEYGEILLRKELFYQKDRYVKLAEKVVKTGLPKDVCLIQSVIGKGHEQSVRITGSLGRVGAHGGLLEILLKPWVDNKLSLWIRHLLLIAAGEAQGDGPQESIILNLGTNVEYRALEPQKAEAFLDDLAGLFFRCLTSGPLPLPKQLAYDYGKMMVPKSENATPPSGPEARNRLLQKNLEDFKFRKSMDKWFAFFMRNDWPSTLRAIVGHPDFHDHAMSVYGPLFKHMKKGR